MKDNETVVREFIDAWREGDARALADFFAEDRLQFDLLTRRSTADQAG